MFLLSQRTFFISTSPVPPGNSGATPARTYEFSRMGGVCGPR